MKRINKLLIYISSAKNFEPYHALEIRSVRDVQEYVEGLTEDKVTTSVECCNEFERDFYALYAYSENDERWVSIADSPSKIELLEIAELLIIASRYSLRLTTKFQF